MYKTIVLLSLGLFFCNCKSVKVTINPSETSSDTTLKKEGWIQLFDGKSTSGWHSYGKHSAGKVWKVEDGVLHLDNNVNETFSDEGGDLVSDEEFDNFDLQIDWKISKKGNSGVMTYVKEDAAKYNAPYLTGPEMQILDNVGHPDGRIRKHRAGDLYDLIASTKDAPNAVGQWNHSEILAKRGKLDLYLNGVHVVNTRMWDDNWRKMIAASKFKAWPDFGTFKKGHIALQDHGNDVWFKNIKIKRL